MFFPANYRGAAMESIPVINGTNSRDDGESFPAGGRLNDLRLKCSIDKQIQKNNIRGRHPQNVQWGTLSSFVNFFTMTHAENNNIATIHVEDHTVITDAKTITTK